MAREQIPLVVLDDASPARVLVGATVEVRHRAGSSGVDGTLASVFADETTAGLLSPLTTNAAGRLAGYLEPGRYRLTAQHADLAAPYVEDFDSNPYVAPTTASQHQARLTRSTSQPIPQAAVTPVQFTVEAFDLPNNDQHDNVTNNSRLTCVEPGFYTIGASWVWAISTVGIRIGYIIHSAVGAVNPSDRRAGAELEGTVSAGLRLAVGEYVEQKVYQDSAVAGGLNLTSAALWWIRHSP